LQIRLFLQIFRKNRFFLQTNHFRFTSGLCGRAVSIFLDCEWNPNVDRLPTYTGPSPSFCSL
jgi:hypothetical protein